jgi:hypothetical protein
MYTLDELELLEWLDGVDADLPTLKKCGVSSVVDLEGMSHSELVQRLGAARQSDETSKRISKRVMEAKALRSFPGNDARAMASRILRHHQASKPLPQGSGHTLPSTPSWSKTLCASAMESDSMAHNLILEVGGEAQFAAHTPMAG